MRVPLAGRHGERLRVHSSYNAGNVYTPHLSIKLRKWPEHVADAASVVLLPAGPRWPSSASSAAIERRLRRFAFECVGLAAAHAKAAELRMGRYKDVILSLAKSSEGDEPTT